MKILGF